MFIINHKITFICLLFVAFVSPQAMAQISNSNSFDENVTITSESLQGIQTQSVEANYEYQRTPKLDVTVEPEEKKGDTNQAPIYTIKKINTNQGDTSDSAGGTIPFANF